MKNFNYENKIWGGNTVKVSPFYLGALCLKYCLEDLQNVHGKILEIGCGAGGMIKAIKSYKQKNDIYGCDISENAINQANKNNKKVKFVVGDAYKLPFKNEFFDAVVMFDVLEHLDKPEKAIKEIHRILKPGGICHSYTPCEGQPANYDFWFRKFGWRGKEKYAGHIQKYNGSDLIEMFRRNKFSFIKKRWSNHLTNQLFDAVYFLMLSIRGKNAQYSLEGFVASTKKTIINRMTNVLVKTVAYLTYQESIRLPNIPGHGIHVTMVKSKD